MKRDYSLIGVSKLWQCVIMAVLEKEQTDIKPLTNYEPAIPKNWEIKGIQFQTAYNCYVCCLTYELDADSMKRMDEDYDTAVRILHPELFLEALTNALGAKTNIRWFGLAPCVYIHRDQHYSPASKSVPPMLIKEPRHSYQREVRLVWETLDAEVEPFLIKGSKASAFCAIVSDQELQESTNSMKTGGH